MKEPRTAVSPPCFESSQVRLYDRRPGLNDHFEQKAVVDDDQKIRSALEYVGIISNASPSGFLVGSRRGIVQKGGACSLWKVPTGRTGQCELARRLRLGAYLRSEGVKVIDRDRHEHRLPIRTTAEVRQPCRSPVPTPWARHAAIRSVRRAKPCAERSSTTTPSAWPGRMRGPGVGPRVPPPRRPPGRRGGLAARTDRPPGPNGACRARMIAPA